MARASRARTRAQRTPLSAGLNPNDLWCTDYKGEFQLGNKRYCYPLTVTYYASRYLLLCEAMDSNREQPAFLAFERLFRERGLPQAIRSDNGVPFASPNGLFNLIATKMSPSRPAQKHDRHKIVYGGVDGTPEINCKLLKINGRGERI